MTEEEAGKKWCPMVRLVPAPHERNREMVRGNRCAAQMDPQVVNYFCIGSRCMMWRWEYRMVNVSTRPDGEVALPSREQSDEGYCGLAGGVR